MAGGKPASIPAVEGRARLRGANLEKMDGANHDRFEVWLDEHLRPYTISFVPPGQTDFLLLAVDEAIAAARIPP